MTQIHKSYSVGADVFMKSYHATATISPEAMKAESHSSESVWTFDFQSTSFPVVFFTPELIDANVLPSNHPIWDEVDRLLETIWAESEYVDPRADDEWLDETRAGWNQRLEDLYDESDTGE